MSFFAENPRYLSEFQPPPAHGHGLSSLPTSPRALSPLRSLSSLSISFPPPAQPANPSPQAPTCEPRVPEVPRERRLELPRKDRKSGSSGALRGSWLLGGGGAGMDRKRIKDALEKHLEKSSPSTSRGVAAKERERLGPGKLPASLGKAGKVSDGGKNLDRSRTFVVLYLFGLPSSLWVNCRIACFVWRMRLFCFLGTESYDEI